MAKSESSERPEPAEERGAALGRPLDPGLERRLQRAMDLGERAFCLLLYAAFFVGMARSLDLRPWNAVVLLSEGLVVFFVIFRRPAVSVSTRPMDWLIALLGTAAPLQVRAGGHPLAPPAIGAGLMAAGVLIGIWAKLTLRRSFALAAANRGVVQSGPYSFVRHPIYAGYMLVYIGFFLANPLTWNAGIYLLTVGLLVLRVLAEEKVLAQDPAYVAFMGKVRYRLAPGLF
jgi:protein-S-isoprenylcysteine O-methyltransferase Ste14